MDDITDIKRIGVSKITLGLIMFTMVHERIDLAEDAIRSKVWGDKYYEDNE